jgi:hypothetical protein
MGRGALSRLGQGARATTSVGVAAVLRWPAPLETPPAPVDPVMWQRGASDAKAKRALSWRARYPKGFAAGL